MSEAVVETLTAKLQETGSDWALTEDSVSAVMRVAADNSINGRFLPFPFYNGSCFLWSEAKSAPGRTLAVVPRIVRKEGYMDMDRDDFPAGSELEKWQEVCLSMTHRLNPPKKV